MMTPCRFYVNDKREKTTKFNLDAVVKMWSGGDYYGHIGENFGFTMNNGIWMHRTENSLTVVTTEGNVLHWLILKELV